VCNAGLPSDTVETLQRGGRVGRREGDQGLFVIFYEPWALTISPDEFTVGDINDPDRPRGHYTLTSRARDWASYSSINLVRCRMCLREYFALYLNDTSPNGRS
jgi:hypothetical protein